MQVKNYRKSIQLSKNNRRRKIRNEDLPAIPNKRYFSISEVSRLCAVEAYVLRYWEQEFSQLRPIKRQGNRRFYQQPDILLLRQIRHLLYEKGFTIEGARAQLTKPIETTSQEKNSQVIVNKIIAELENVLQNLRATMTMKYLS
jgi:DNA-binding transcriptional MerR regulator